MSETAAPALNELQRHRVQFPYGDPRGTMKSLPAIQKTMSASEAEQRRQNYEFPDMIPGEPVFYRRANKGGDAEDMGWYITAHGRTARIIIARPGYTMEEKSSVGYWDHTEENPALTGDPKAAFNNNGTFRRTPFGKFLSKWIAANGGGALAGLPGNNEVMKLREEFIAMLAELREEINKMKQEEAAASGGRGSKNKQ